MSDVSPVLALPLIQPSQAQKHVTHNEALRLLDVLVQPAVATRGQNAPPVSPQEGERHIVGTAPTGAWAGQPGCFAWYEAGQWAFLTPQEGWTAQVQAEAAETVYRGGVWTTPADGPLRVAQMGVNAAPDGFNRLTVQGDAVLLTHGAGGGHQVKVNKAVAGDTASLLFQTGFSGRAEMGTSGSDGFQIKVSADGSAWFSALATDPATGRVTLPAPLLLGGQPADPAGPANGTLWLDAATGEVKCRSAGQSVVIAPGDGGSPLGQWDHWSENWFPNTTAAAYDLWTAAAISSGTVQAVTSGAIRQGFNPYGVTLRSSTTANSGYRYVTSSAVSDWFGVSSRKFRGRIGTWDTISPTGIARIGWLDTTTSADSTDGAYFEIAGAVLSCKTATGGSRTTHPTTLALTAAQAYALEIDVPASGASVRFRVWQGTGGAPVLDVTIATTIPVAVANAFGAGAVATDSGTAATNVVVLYSLGIGTVAGYARATGRS
ncbi:MAG TPA: DUF2793 domain-containing protein [Paracoccaceae bacterium]|mgnify:CR=1 FL=1|nr:DUF2793 domain-containing protein [Paracoccaceae bacterium]HMO71816.1 DUF2793 domain-containing protein [Paracoccaceae bacterium]